MCTLNIDKPSILEQLIDMHDGGEVNVNLIACVLHSLIPPLESWRSRHRSIITPECTAVFLKFYPAARFKISPTLIDKLGPVEMSNGDHTRVDVIETGRI